MNQKERIIAETVSMVKTTLALLLVVGGIMLIGAVAAYTTPTHTFSDDHYTIANTTDGEEVVVTFEIVYERVGDMDTADRKRAMDNMNLAQSCTNERLDAHIESHTADEVRGSNLSEITADCGNEYITVERVNTTDAFNT
jgi:hypothetical protein